MIGQEATANDSDETTTIPRTETFSSRAQRDLEALKPFLLLPLGELRRFNLSKHGRLITLAAIGLAPLAIVDILGETLSVSGIYWSFALYSSALWFACFMIFFKNDEGRTDRRALFGCFFGTSLLAVSILLPLTAVPPLSWLHQLARPNVLLPVRVAASIIGIGVPEELTKAAALFLLWRLAVPAAPRTMLFYGLISGLGFGIREGILYQTGGNVEAAGGDLALYYLLNVLRLTSLPFLHAIWTGIAGYFIGFARAYPHRRAGLLVIAIGLPAILHGCYDAIGGSIGIAVAVFSVLLLGLYLGTSEHFESSLTEEQKATITVS